MSRRLATNLSAPQCSESQRLEAEARAYVKVRQAYVQEAANNANVRLSIMEAQAIDQTADSFSQGSFPGFCAKVDNEIADFARKNPDKVRHSVLEDWMNEDMNDQEKARREIAGWMDNPKIAYFDTETTGFFDEGHVPVNIAACGHEDNKLCVIQIAPLNEKGEPISITEGASKANHLTDAMLAGYEPLEESEWAIRELEMLAEGGYILTGYNTKFDRDMMGRALDYAEQRASVNATEDEIKKGVPTERFNRLFALHKYFSDPSHWLETKDTFCRAVGEEPYPGPGKYLRLEDIARRTNALTADETQAHGALADCQLLARIVRNIRKEIEDMAPKPKAAPVAKQTEEIQTEPESTGEWPQDALEHIATLETALHQAEERANKAEADLYHADANCIALSEQLAQYQNGEATKHHEARDVTWSDIEINGFQFNFTRREGITVEQSIEAIMDHIRIMQALKANEKVVTLRVGLKGDWKPLKGFDKPANGKPADDQPPADAIDTDRRAARGLPPTANKLTPPPAKPANTPAPQGGQPAQQPGNAPAKTPGEPASEMYVNVTRNEMNGENTYMVLPILRNGKPADKPKPVAKRDVKAFEKALTDVGWAPESFEKPGEPYNVKMRGDWVWGNPIDPAKPDGPRYHDKMTYTVLLDEPF